MFQVRLSNKPSELSKLKIINKLVAKEYANEYKVILNDIYIAYITLLKSYSEIEDLFSNIFKVAKHETKVTYPLFNFKEKYEFQIIIPEEFTKLYMKDDFLKLILIEAKKYTIPDIFKQMIEILEKLDIFQTEDSVSNQNNQL